MGKLTKMRSILIILLGSFLSSCFSTKEAVYFANDNNIVYNNHIEEKEPLIQKNDLLSIYISSLNEDATLIFNAQNHLATSTSTSAGYTEAGGYLVNSDGFIQLPIIGNIKASGITKNKLRENIIEKINTRQLLIDPIVTIRHLNYEVTIIGEVGKPTVINVPNEKISLLKALGIAGDITVYGKKNNVLIIRENNGTRTLNRINLNQKEFMKSPFYFLESNDIVYVEPNQQKIKNANTNQQLISTILSGMSIIAIIITQLIKK